jgi:hypothetical protein
MQPGTVAAARATDPQYLGLASGRSVMMPILSPERRTGCAAWRRAGRSVAVGAGRERGRPSRRASERGSRGARGAGACQAEAASSRAVGHGERVRAGAERREWVAVWVRRRNAPSTAAKQCLKYVGNSSGHVLRHLFVNPLLTFRVVALRQRGLLKLVRVGIKLHNAGLHLLV